MARTENYVDRKIAAHSENGGNRGTETAPSHYLTAKITYWINSQSTQVFTSICRVISPNKTFIKQKNEYVLRAECQGSFENLKRQVANIVKFWHFDMHKDIRIVCDASHNGLGSVLGQLSTKGCEPISFTSRYLNFAKKGYSTNKLEMLANVWGQNTSGIMS